MKAKKLIDWAKDDERWLKDWCSSTDSVAELWASDRLRQQIRDWTEAGGDVKPFTVELRVRKQDFGPLPPELAAQLGELNLEEVPVADHEGGQEELSNVALAKKALFRVQRYLGQGYQVLGYMDNTDHAEILVGRPPQDEAGQCRLADRKRERVGQLLGEE